MEEVDDIYKIASEADSDLNEFIIARYRHGLAMQFSSQRRNTIIQVSVHLGFYILLKHIVLLLYRLFGLPKPSPILLDYILISLMVSRISQWLCLLLV